MDKLMSTFQDFFQGGFRKCLDNVCKVLAMWEAPFKVLLLLSLLLLYCYYYWNAPFSKGWWSEVKCKSLSWVRLFATPWTSSWNSPGQNTRVGSLSLLQGSSQPRDWTQVSRIADGFFSSWATREALRDGVVYLNITSRRTLSIWVVKLLWSRHF